MKVKKLFFNSLKFLLRKPIFLPILIAFFILCNAASSLTGTIYLVYDGETKSSYSSSHSNASDFIKEVGLVLSEDKYFDLPEKPDNGIAKIYIKNKNALKLTVDGEEKTLYALNDQKISDVLAEYGIILDQDDIISVPLTEAASDGLEFEITRVSHTTKEVIKTIPFTTEEKPSDTLDKGKKEVVKEGVEGSKKLVYEIRMENGTEVSRKLVSETVIKEPEAKIVEYGTREKEPEKKKETKPSKTENAPVSKTNSTEEEKLPPPCCTDARKKSSYYLGRRNFGIRKSYQYDSYCIYNRALIRQSERNGASCKSRNGCR